MKDKYDTLVQESRNVSITRRGNHNIVSDHSISVERFIADQSKEDNTVDTLRVQLDQTRREN